MSMGIQQDLSLATGDVTSRGDVAVLLYTDLVKSVVQVMALLAQI
jgi:hypothetical protein